MASDELDTVDKGILYLLQQNARNKTTADIGEKVGVSSSTVGNRINKLEECGVITGYQQTVDYEKAGLSHHLLLVVTILLREQPDIVDEIMDVRGIVCVRQMLTDRQNVSLELVGHTQEEIEQSLTELNAIGVEVERMEIIKRERTQPFGHFGKQFTNEDETG